MMRLSASLWAWSWSRSCLQGLDRLFDERSSCPLEVGRRREVPTEKFLLPNKYTHHKLDRRYCKWHWSWSQVRTRPRTSKFWRKKNYQKNENIVQKTRFHSHNTCFAPSGGQLYQFRAFLNFENFEAQTHYYSIVPTVGIKFVKVSTKTHYYSIVPTVHATIIYELNVN